MIELADYSHCLPAAAIATAVTAAAAAASARTTTTPSLVFIATATKRAQEESADFARVAARFNATIVPVAAVGAEEGFEMVLDADEALEVTTAKDRNPLCSKRTLPTPQRRSLSSASDPNAQLPYFGERLREGAKNQPVGRPGERFVTPISVPKVPGRYYFLFGAPISTAEVNPSDRDACAALYTSVQTELEGCIDFLLEKRQEDPYEPALPRAAVEASWGFEQQAPTFRL